MIPFLLNAALFIVALFLILLVLVQRGRGGGLAGALGGMGGQSAFGTKAGDVFTKVTIITAAVWILLSAMAVKYYRPQGEENIFQGVTGPNASSAIPATNPGSPVPTATSTATGAPAEGAASTTPDATPPAPATAVPPVSTPPASTATGTAAGS